MRYLSIFLLIACSSQTDPKPVTQPKQIKDGSGNVYQTIVLDGKTWLDKDLMTTTFIDGVSVPHFGDGYYPWFKSDALCPAGFRVPTIEELSEVSKLSTRGYWIDGGIVSNGIGYYWSSSEVNAIEAYCRVFVDEGIVPYPKNYGLCVRCIKK